jgi:ribosomal protein S18 acetylase RimI-like enzyme
MEPSFVKAAPEDADDIVRLMRELYSYDRLPFDEPRARAALTALLAEASYGCVFVARSLGVAIGYLALTFGFSLEYGGRDAFIDELYLAPSHRGRGLGRAALALAERVCREAGVRALHLEVERPNERARAVYGSYGFKEHERFLMTLLL